MQEKWSYQIKSAPSAQFSPLLSPRAGAPTATLTAAVPESTPCKASISSVLAVIPSCCTITAFFFCAKLEQDHEKWLSTEPSFYSIALSASAPPPSPCKSHSVFSLASSPSTSLYKQVLIATQTFLLHRIDTNKYRLYSRTAHDALPT